MATDAKSLRAICDELPALFPNLECHRHGDDFVVMIDARLLVASEDLEHRRVVVWAELAHIEAHQAQAAAKAAAIFTQLSGDGSGAAIGMTADGRGLTIGRSVERKGLTARSLRALLADLSAAAAAQTMISDHCAQAERSAVADIPDDAFLMKA